MSGPIWTYEQVYDYLDRRVRGLLVLEEAAEALSHLSPHSAGVCTQVLDLCWSGMERLAPSEAESRADHVGI